MPLQVCSAAGRRLLDSILPPLCLGCGEIVGTPGTLCATCWPTFSFIAPPHCACCGTPFDEDLGADVLCTACLARRLRFRRARAALTYDDRSRRLVLPFKHGDRADMARTCGAWMARAGAELLVDADLVAPVPLHWRRLFTRRYNQALVLARNLTRETLPSSRPICCCASAGPDRGQDLRRRNAGATSERLLRSIRAGARA